MQKGRVYNPHMKATERERWLARRVETLEARLQAERAKLVRERDCPICGDVVRSEGQGRPRLYCSDSCRYEGKLRSNRKAHAKARAIEREVGSVQE